MHECPHCGSQKSVSKGAGRRTCVDCTRHYAVVPLMQQLTLDASKADKFSQDRFVITSAVCNTLAHPGFLASLEVYCKAVKARLIVVPIRYKNPTRGAEANAEEWFDERLEPYLYRGRAALADNLTLFADIAVQPTAGKPLSGLTTLGGIGGHDSAIFGHPKIAMESVATAPGKMAKWAMTTGAVTRADYSDSKTGKKGEFHHMLAALVVEREGGRFHVRHVVANSKDGSFYDLGKKYDKEGFEQGIAARVLTCGDLHAVRANKETLEATFFAPDSVVQTTKPANIVLHDVLDFQSASHHNGFFTRFKLYGEGKNSVTEEVRRTCELLDAIALAAPWATIYIVDSNHDKHFERWLEGDAGGHDLTNALMFFRTKTAWLEAIAGKQKFSPLEYWARRLMTEQKRVVFLTANDSLVFDKVEYGQHGDRAANGARGTRNAFASVGTKMVIGHSHSPGVSDGIYQVGTTSELDMDYNRGFSSWLNAHVLSYPNGKRTIVTVVNGSWRRSGK